MNRKLIIGCSILVLATAFPVYDLGFKEYPSILFTSQCRLSYWNNIIVGSTTILDAKKLMEATVGKANVDYNDYIQLVGFRYRSTS